jgi:predicted dienelactone hydrolase
MPAATCRTFLRLLAALAATLVLVIPAIAGADSLAIVPPRSPGGYAVGCSDIAQDFSRIAPGATADNYWEGEQGRYVSSLLLEPAATFTADITPPDDRELFGRFAGQTLPFVLLVCYPTTPDNPRPAYVLPNGKGVPHMQRGGDAPLFAGDRALFPVLLFSHGLSGSPLSSDYLDAVTELASHGYVVIAPFHGDARIANITLEDLEDAVHAILNFSDYTAMQALRPLTLSVALDTVFGDPRYAARMDANAIGGFGGSLGGESVMLMAGAALTVSVGQSSRPVIHDPRLKAAVGYVPYFGQVVLPAFGRDQRGLDSVTMPYMAISGTLDTVAPLVVTAKAMERLPGAREFIALEDVRHGFDRASAPDIFTWALTFLDAYVQDDPLQRAKIARMTAVEGGGRDDLVLDRAVPLLPLAGERIAVEFYNPSLDHYFITAEPAEAAMLDAGIVVPGWVRTGYTFKVGAADAATGLPACRFFGRPPFGPNSHFFTIDPAECDKVLANPLWMFEGIAFRAEPPQADDCPADRVPVVRLYNDGKGGEANHRFVTSHSEINSMLGQGWIREGAVFCGLP